jgi:hypothetical protein
VAIRDRPEDVAAFLAAYGNPFSRIGKDDISAVQLSIGSSGVPETFVIDGKGVIRYQHIGDIRDSDVSVLLAEAARGRRMIVALLLALLVALSRRPLAAQDLAAAGALRLPPARRPGARGQGAGADGDAALPQVPEPVDRRQRRADGRRHAPPGAHAHRRGRGPEHIRAWLVERYGDYVSYKPT